MKAKKKNIVVKWDEPIKVVKGMPNLDNDPFFIKKREDAIKAMLENPPPEWILKKMRGED